MTNYPQQPYPQQPPPQRQPPVRRSSTSPVLWLLLVLVLLNLALTGYLVYFVVSVQSALTQFGNSLSGITG